ncbi:hypothetical protein KP509_28G060200 [Ceratopteris richardii]|nr:hypothetical protein KP509_28G060200 [Ceratopteris richardii]
MSDKLYPEIGSQLSAFESTEEYNASSSVQSFARGAISSSYEFRDPVKDYNPYHEQSTSGYYGARSDFMPTMSNEYMGTNKYEIAATALHFPSEYNAYARTNLSSSASSLTDLSSGGTRRAQEYELKVAGGFPTVGHEQDSFYRSARLDCNAYPELGRQNFLGAYDATAFRQAESEIGKDTGALSLLQNDSRMNVQGIDTKDASVQLQVDSVAPRLSASKEKRKKSRWEPVEGSENSIEEGMKKARKKTRWSDSVSPAKEDSRPDMTNEISVDISEEVALRARLIVINQMLQTGQFHGKENGDMSPSPEPIFDNFGFRMNTREWRAREKLNKERQRIMNKLSNLEVPSDVKDPQSSKFVKHIDIPVDKYPDYNFVGLILGPRGRTQKVMEMESGAKISVKGTRLLKGGEVAKQDGTLFVKIEAISEESMNKAAAMVEKLLVPVEDDKNEHKKAQLRELALLNKSVQSNDTHNVSSELAHSSKDCAAGSTAGLSMAAIQKPGGATDSVNNNDDRTVIYVSSLPLTVDDSELSNLFSPFGKIVYANVVKHPTTRSSQGYGFVKFVDATDAAQAVALMHGYGIDGNVLIVKPKSKMETTT